MLFLHDVNVICSRTFVYTSTATYRYNSLANSHLGSGFLVENELCEFKSILFSLLFQQVAFQSNTNHPLAESMGYIKFEET